MVSLKDRRNSGRYTPSTDISKKELIRNNIEIPIEYDDWNNYRDSFRDWYRDGKMIKKSINRKYAQENEYDIKRAARNNKQKRLLKIRRARNNKKL